MTMWHKVRSFGLPGWILLMMCAFQTSNAQTIPPHKWAVVLHGGAGVIERGSMDAKTEAAYRSSIQKALQAAADVLDKGGSSLDAVETAIQLLEDDPLFNAGRG